MATNASVVLQWIQPRHDGNHEGQAPRHLHTPGSDVTPFPHSATRTPPADALPLAVFGLPLHPRLLLCPRLSLCFWLFLVTSPQFRCLAQHVERTHWKALETHMNELHRLTAGGDTSTIGPNGLRLYDLVGTLFQKAGGSQQWAERSGRDD